MVAYNFKSRFAEPIVAGTKGGTIRATRGGKLNTRRATLVGGHAFPDEMVQLYTGMRTKHCRLIARKICIAVHEIELDFAHDEIRIGEEMFFSEKTLEAFARFDGFASFAEMADFWRNTHGDPFFEGWHIRWLPLPWERV